MRTAHGERRDRDAAGAAGFHAAVGTLHVLNSGPCRPAWNMALDEALLMHAGSRGTPLLRFYGWTEGAATFGYSQRYAVVERQTMLRPLIRRPTGGGLVPHDRDWTYSFSVPPGHPWHGLRAPESYEAIHRWIQLAFARMGVVTELAECARSEAPGQCFVGHERSDVLWGGRKIAGAAQRRNRQGLLIQGSVQPPPGLRRADWEQAMIAVAAEWFGEVSQRAADPDAEATALRLESEKYSRSEYNSGR